MPRYVDMIKRHEKDMQSLHDRIHVTFKKKNQSVSKRELWLRACQEFRDYRSGVDNWIADIRDSSVCDWTDAREFIADFFLVDPYYFRSGYTAELLIKKLKACVFSSEECEVIRGLIINRIRKGGRRDFKKFCGQIPKVADASFIAELKSLANAEDISVRRRAELALKFDPF